MAQIDALFRTILESGASDLHLHEGQPPKMRLHGTVEKINDQVLYEETLRSYMDEICADDRWQHFLDTGDLDFAYSLGQEARFRANYFHHANGFGAIFRIIPTDIQSIADLSLPQVLTTFADLPNGLVLVTGPTGSGKSTTLAAVIDHINTNFARHILTIEEPIEFVHTNKRSIIVQREVGIDVESFGRALMDAGHGDCDVILVGEMRDLDTISLAISAAEAGNLVFGTLHTNSAAKTIDRLIDVFPPDQQPQVRTMLSESLRGVCSQLLLKRKGGGRIAVNEILLHTQAVANIIREGAGSLHKLHAVMMGGKSLGMQLMDDVIDDCHKKGLVTGHEAYMKALDKERFENCRDEH
jgi:twitching motility protein PilT